MTQQHTEELDKQGDVNAIEALINELLEPNGIKAKVGLKDSCLYVACLSAQIPERQALVRCIAKRILRLGIKSLQSAKIYATLHLCFRPLYTAGRTLYSKRRP